MAGAGALQRNPGLTFCGIEDVRLLKGVIVRDDQPETLRVLSGKATRADGVYRVPVELRGTLASGREFNHARGAVVLGDRLPISGGEDVIALPSLTPFGAMRGRFTATCCSTDPTCGGSSGSKGVTSRGSPSFAGPHRRRPRGSSGRFARHG